MGEVDDKEGAGGTKERVNEGGKNGWGCWVRAGRWMLISEVDREYKKTKMNDIVIRLIL